MSPKRMPERFLAEKKIAREKQRLERRDQKSARAAFRLYLENVPVIQISEHDAAVLAAGDALHARMPRNERENIHLIKTHINKLRGQGVKGRAKLRLLKTRYALYRTLAK